MNNSEEEKRIIIADDSVQINVFLGEDPFAHGHLVIQPKNEAHDISELTKSNWDILALWIPRVTKAMKRALKKVTGNQIEKIYLCSFNESEEHTVHFHLVPRYASDTLKGPTLLCENSAKKIAISPKMIKDIVNEMRKELAAY